MLTIYRLHHEYNQIITLTDYYLREIFQHWLTNVLTMEKFHPVSPYPDEVISSIYVYWDTRTHNNPTSSEELLTTRKKNTTDFKVELIN